MDKHEYTNPHMRSITGIISSWAVVTFTFEGEIIANEHAKQGVTFLLGDVDIDYNDRFPPGSYIKTSLVRHFNKTDFTVITRNSCYQLNGNLFYL